MNEPLNFEKFKVESQASDLIQIYVTRESHRWIKNMANTNNVKMAYVMAELISYAENDTKAFKHILETLCELATATESVTLEPKLMKKLTKLLIGAEKE